MRSAEELAGPDVAPQLVNEEVRRRNLGIYYTPRHAATLLANWAIRDARDCVLEPSFGGCSLLGAAVVRLKELGCKSPSKQLRGFDVDPAAFDHLIELFPNELSLDRFRLSDFLTVDADKRDADVVLANPPFVAYRQMTSDQREVIKRWRHRYSGGFSMESALWLYFLAHSLQFLKGGGRLAFVLPGSFLTSDYVVPVRSRLEHLFRSVRVIEVNERLFASVGAQERACLLLAAGYEPTGYESAVRTVHVACERLEEDFLWKGPAELNGNHQELRSTASSLLECLHNTGRTTNLGALAHPYIGEVTGDVHFFVKTRDEWAQLGIHLSELTPVIHGSATAPGAIAPGLDGAERFMLTPSSSDPCQPVAAYLATYSPEKRMKNRTFAKRKPWWRVSCCTTAYAFVPSLHNAYFKLLVNDAALACTNSTYRLMPVGKGVNKYAIGLGALTTIAQLSAELQSRKLGGGALKLEPSNVSNVSLPVSILDLQRTRAEEQLRLLDGLVRDGFVSQATENADRLLLEDGLMTGAEVQQARSLLRSIRSARRGLALTVL